MVIVESSSQNILINFVIFYSIFSIFQGLEKAYKENGLQGIWAKNQPKTGCFTLASDLFSHMDPLEYLWGHC